MVAARLATEDDRLPRHEDADPQATDDGRLHRRTTKEAAIVQRADRDEEIAALQVSFIIL